MKKLFLTFAALALCPAISHADLVFDFQESGGTVTMTSSGTLETANLVAGAFGGWGGTGLQFNVFSMMGGAVFGGTDTAFGFNAGTDFSPWATPWGSDKFSWTKTAGAKGFATYNTAGGFVPGIHVLAADMVGTTWTPDQDWTISGSFASLDMNEGVYTVSDAITGESITYKIGTSSVPEPSSLMMIGLLGCAGLFRRRR